ncbi:hypothetical protein, partial [Klebsiella michiganensis]|uniref:hypothetical protein n=1 Tax=Klebsiella michiganensis TaxID=1134687 RepID=UPI001A917B40
PPALPVLVPLAILHRLFLFGVWLNLLSYPAPLLVFLWVYFSLSQKIKPIAFSPNISKVARSQ